jgi:hypothetical protein
MLAGSGTDVSTMASENSSVLFGLSRVKGAVVALKMGEASGPL